MFFYNASYVLPTVSFGIKRYNIVLVYIDYRRVTSLALLSRSNRYAVV